MTTTKEITIYEKTNENSVLYLYCEDCKPKGGKRGTLVLSNYDHCCAGCGEDFLELAAEPAIISTPKTPTHFIIREEQHPLQVGASVFRVYHEDGTPLYIGRETVEEAEKALRRSELVHTIEIVYLDEARNMAEFERMAELECYQQDIANFAQAVAIIGYMQTDAFELDGPLEVQAWEEAGKRLEAWLEEQGEVEAVA